MLIKTNNKWDAVRALINTLLKDKTFYCNYCGADYNPNNFPCCEEPQVGRHAEHIRGIVKQNKEIKETRKNDFSETEDKSLRWGASLPPRFFKELETAWKTTYGEKLLKDNSELHRFLREFPAFAVCNKV